MTLICISSRKWKWKKLNKITKATWFTKL